MTVRITLHAEIETASTHVLETTHAPLEQTAGLPITIPFALAQMVTLALQPLAAVCVSRAG